MKKADKDFYDFVLSNSPGASFTKWLKEMQAVFEASVHCSACGDKNVTIIVDPKVVLWCESCQIYSETTLDTLTGKDYSAVTFLHKDKIIDILRYKESM